MRKFESVVMSQTEPVETGTLWLRTKGSTIGDPKQFGGMSIWWFGPRGWQPLMDFDTRYNISNGFSYDASGIPVDSSSSSDPEHGIVDVEETFHLYDASRDIGEHSNLVTEKGLKKHVDELQKEIDALEKRADDIEAFDSKVNAEITVIRIQLTAIEETLKQLKTWYEESEHNKGTAEDSTSEGDAVSDEPAVESDTATEEAGTPSADAEPEAEEAPAEEEAQPESESKLAEDTEPKEEPAAEE